MLLVIQNMLKSTNIIFVWDLSLSKILNPKVAPDVQLAPCEAATAISKGPAMSWRLIQGIPWPIE